MRWQTKYLLYFFSLFMLFKNEVKSAGCPKNWQQHNGFCFMYSSKTLAYDEGEHFCHHFLESSMVDVLDEKENSFVTSLIRRRTWLAFRRCHSQRFFWTDSEPANFTFWASGEPDNKDTSEQCVFMWRNGSWSDGICLERKPFVCQKLTSNCSNVSQCFALRRTPAKWQEARSKCQADGLRLAKISNTNENDAVMGLLDGFEQAWIGLERHDMFCSGSQRISYKNWDFHEPNDRSLVENCIAVGRKGKWSDENCNKSLAVICKRDLDECIEKEAYGCDENSVCTNTAGSFSCGTCKDGYSRDGTNCSKRNVAVTVLASLFGVSCLVIFILFLYISQKRKHWL